MSPAQIDPRGAGEPLVTLLARALRSYGRAIRAQLREHGFTDLPPSSGWVLAALARRPATATELGLRLDRSKQSVSRLADLLVQRGYAEPGARRPDRRQVVLRLTARGAAAAVVVLEAAASVDARLGQLDQTRARELREALIRLRGAGN